MKSQSLFQPRHEFNSIQSTPSPVDDTESFQKMITELMNFNIHKINTDTRIAMLDGAADSLSKALNANIKQTDGINF